jgi:hypothetical protein
VWQVNTSMALSMVGSFLLMLPTSWVYRAERRRKGFDQSVVRTVLVLAVAVAGVVVIARNSLALAFSLPGVVGANVVTNDDKKPPKEFDAVLLVRARDADKARTPVESILSSEVRRFKLVEVETSSRGRGVLKYLIRIGKRLEPAHLEDALLLRAAPHVVGARVH